MGRPHSRRANAAAQRTSRRANRELYPISTVHEFFAVSLSLMSELRDEPPPSLEDPREILLQQLSYYRATLLAKLKGLSEAQLTTSVLPSGWSPLGLLKHLVFVERRWMQWGFEAEPIPDPWGDHDPDSEGWLVAPEDTVADLTARLAAIAARTEAVAGQAELTQRARLDGRFSSDPPTLGWILIHLLQEYARHVGHLDVVRELIDGSVGE
jgi:uncharacterized damage-inducible protein DinB